MVRCSVCNCKIEEWEAIIRCPGDEFIHEECIIYHLPDGFECGFIRNGEFEVCDPRKESDDIEEILRGHQGEEGQSS